MGLGGALIELILEPRGREARDWERRSTCRSPGDRLGELGIVFGGRPPEGPKWSFKAVTHPSRSRGCARAASLPLALAYVGDAVYELYVRGLARYSLGLPGAGGLHAVVPSWVSAQWGKRGFGRHSRSELDRAGSSNRPAGPQRQGGGAARLRPGVYRRSDGPGGTVMGYLHLTGQEEPDLGIVGARPHEALGP